MSGIIDSSQLLTTLAVKSMDNEDHDRLYGNPKNVIQYMDYQENPVPDNSRYIPELVPGILQPLEINEIMEDPNTDEWLSNLDIEKIVKQAEESTKDVEEKIQKDMKRFPEPTKPDTLQEFSMHTFSAATCRKAQWASRIFDQWKCIRNFKLKQNNELPEKFIQGTLLNMEID